MKPEAVFNVKGRIVLITGACGIVGRHFTKVLSSNGANVAITDLDEKACQSFAEEIKKEYHTDPLGIALDLRKEASVKSCVTAIIKKYGKVDVLINNAVVKSKNYFAPLEEYSLEEWKEVMDVNVTGMFLCAKHAIPHMKQGSIINMSSIYGIVGPQKEMYEGMPTKPAPAIYSVSKGGVVMLTKWIAAMYGDKGIRANTLTLGGVSEHQLGGNDFEKKYSSRTPLRRMTTLKDTTGPILFLASDASSGMTGHNLVVDGGWTII
jgi:NAD(P)-dependent dehydrogenase (short-subunit alcohol dehydrogenase family)